MSDDGSSKFDFLIRIMRKMLSTKAGATFSLDCPQYTIAVRKDVVEIIFKVKPGVYLVVNLSRVDATRGMLFVNWGSYWNRLTNEKLQLPKLEKCCPVLYEILTGDDKDGIIEMKFGATAEDAEHGFGLEVALPDKLSLLLCLTPSVINKAGIMKNKMLTIYNELVKNPPFPAWKTGLEEVWE